MLSLSLALAQAVSASPPERVDLTIPQPCQPAAAEDGEVIVCANRDGSSPYRLQEPPAPQRTGTPKAELTVAEGVSVAAESEEGDAGGVPTNRGMIRLKVKF